MQDLVDPSSVHAPSINMIPGTHMIRGSVRINTGVATCSCHRRCQAPEIHTNLPVDAFLSDAFALGVMFFVMDVMDYPWACTIRGKCPLYDYFHMFGIRRFVGKRRLRRRGAGQCMSDVISKDATLANATLGMSTLALAP